VQSVARYEDRRSRRDRPGFAFDPDRASSFDYGIDLGLPVPVFVQRPGGGYFRDAHGEPLATGEVSAKEGLPVGKPPFGDVFVRPRLLPLEGAFLDDNGLTVHPLTSLSVRSAALEDSFPFVE
jgi:hypothetical protein